MIDIYRVTFPNGKSYIGITTEGLYKRKVRHLYDSKKFDFKFYRALNKYSGQETWEVIDQVEDVSLAYLLEITYIDLYNSYYEGYNSTFGGEGKHGTKASKKTRLRQRLAKLGKKAPYRDDIWRRNISLSKSGEKGPMAKLTKEDIDYIKDMRKNGLWLKDISSMFQIVDSHVSNICRGVAWKNG